VTAIKAKRRDGTRRFGEATTSSADPTVAQPTTQPYAVLISNAEGTRCRLWRRFSDLGAALLESRRLNAIGLLAFVEPQEPRA
jgi:hypothetical protein